MWVQISTGRTDSEFYVSERQATLEGVLRTPKYGHATWKSNHTFMNIVFIPQGARPIMWATVGVGKMKMWNVEPQHKDWNVNTALGVLGTS